MVFLDTSAIYALADTRDRNFVNARELMQRVFTSGEKILTSSYVMVEAAALLQRRLGIDPALRFLNEARRFEIHWVAGDDHLAAVLLLGERKQRRLSLVDCMSFLVMRRHGVQQALVFDGHFEDEGFVLYPGT